MTTALQGRCRMRTLVSAATIVIVVTTPDSTWTSSRNSVTAATLQASQATVFEGARLIVGDGSTVEDGILVVEGGVITRVGKRDGPVVPQGATRVSLVGKTIMPLLADLHGHIGFLKDGVFAAENYSKENIRDQLERLEYYGVGAFQSLGTDLGLEAFDVREEQRAGKTGGARLLLAGRGFVAPGGGPQVTPLEHVPFEVDQPVLARQLVRELVARKVDMIKEHVSP